MASGCETALGIDCVRGIVIVPQGSAIALRSIRGLEASHPVPDQRAVAATEEVCRLLESDPDGPVVCLISGGASSLLVRPRHPLTLDDKQQTTRLLLASGASIQEANTVRKHLSEVKGGGLLRYAGGRRVVSLILSDVVGDDASVIGSGPTAADRTTFSDALGVLARWGLEAKVPPAVRSLLERGSRGEIPETAKPGGPELERVRNFVIGTNGTALEGAAEEARRLGYRTVISDRSLTGDTTECARRWAAEVLRHQAGEPLCVLAGGETTVVVKGTGRGGRNQEFALAAAETLAGTEVHVLSAGTDGVDGPTPAAGAFVDGRTVERARDLAIDPRRVLLDNDSYAFFEALHDLFVPGPTGTNVMDIKIALNLGSASHPPVLQD
jgi:hydroxypyruvate reductase